jgi:C4-dicarboxylate transporter, DctM subunit
MGAIMGPFRASVWVPVSRRLDWTGAARDAVGLGLLFTSIPMNRLLPQYAFNILTTPDLLALPLFVLMGNSCSGPSFPRPLFSGPCAVGGPAAWSAPARKRHWLLDFATISGSSAATTQVVGRMTLKELLKRGYSPDIAIGSLAGAGTLGFLIPPSTVMIMYGLLAEGRSCACSLPASCRAYCWPPSSASGS